MKKYDYRHKENTVDKGTNFNFLSFCFYLSVLLFLSSFNLFAQEPKVTIDSTSIKIGEQITYQIQVEVDTTILVVFPEGQTFLPLEMIESYKVDATRHDNKFNLIKRYGLTQFDSGTYTIPRQKILIGDLAVYTDSLRVEVNTIAIDTTQQPLYSIKPIIDVDKSPSKQWLYVLLTILILSVIGFLMYWFIWREKPMTEEEKVSLLPPYERAKLALRELDETDYLENQEIKAYYSELTGIIRKYLDEKVYNHALESTTEQLINRLHLLKDGNQIDLSKEDIANIDSILKRADLVKFAKSKPDIELAKLDRNTIDMEIDQVKEALPEPTEEERLEDLKYQEELALKKKRRKIIITVVVSLMLIIGTFVGFTINYGFIYVKDSIIGHPSKELLEVKEWITSEYGAPGITISTPKVLERMSVNLPEQLDGKVKVAMFGYGSLMEQFNIVVSTSKFASSEPQESGGQQEESDNQIDLNQAAEGNLKNFEQNGVQNLITKNEQFITPNGQEGLKTFGTADFPLSGQDKFDKGNYLILGFTTQNILQQVVITWREDDVYANQIVDRILNSIELIKLEEED